MQTPTPTINAPLIAHPLTPSLVTSNAVQRKRITLAEGEIRELIFSVDSDATTFAMVHLTPDGQGDAPDIALLRNAGVALTAGSVYCYTLDPVESGRDWSIYYASRNDDAAATLRVETRIFRRRG